MLYASAMLIGHHVVKSGHGLWLPGDERGSWRKEWDQQIGEHGSTRFAVGDPIMERMARERLKHPPVTWTLQIQRRMFATLRRLVAESGGELNIPALAIEETHLHLLVKASRHPIESTARWISHQLTIDIQAMPGHRGPVFAEGRWRGWIRDDRHWEEAYAYIQSHNTRRGRPALALVP